uniref:Uncharacterized protein n=1 Tax=Arundo donax TaxID=35708 RepID=A0A0A9E4U5_ARUDO
MTRRSDSISSGSSPCCLRGSAPPPTRRKIKAHVKPVAGFTGEVKASETKKLVLFSFKFIFVSIYKMTSRYSILVCVKLVKPKPVKILPNGS